MQFSWTQYHNPDRYDGLEYVTGNDVRIESLDGTISAIYPASVDGVAQVRFTPEWPGNYRFVFVVTDKDGESSKSAEVMVRFRENPFQLRGVAIYFPWQRIEDRAIRELIDRAKGNGSNWVLLRIHYFTPDNSSSVVSCNQARDSGCTTPTETQLASIIDYAHAAGLRVLLECDVLMGKAKLEPWQVDVSNKAAWLADLFAVDDDVARIAEARRVEMLSLGCDLGWALEQPGWLEHIASIRSVYSGELTITDSGLTFGAIPSGPNPPVYFAPVLDLSAFPWAYAYCGSSTRPSVDELEADLAQRFDDNTLPTIQARGLPFFTSAPGLLNADGAILPRIPGTPSPQVIDNQEQVDYFEAALRLLKAYGSKGVVFWAYNPELPEGGHEVNGEIRGRAAEKLMSVWFR